MKSLLMAYAACAALLCGCAMPGQDSFGNEPRPFGVDETAQDDTLVYLAQSRSDLIVYCHDNRGILSQDGLNCVFPASLPNLSLNPTPPCTIAYAKDQARDEPWANAVCSGWHPGI